MARLPRRTFAAPFVVTLAACSGTHTNNPPGPRPPEPPPASTEPAPSTDPGSPGAPASEPSAGPPIHRNPPPPQPKPKPAEYEQHWYVTNVNGKCSAMPRVDCPKAEPGKPQMTCNPPPPIAYACPPNAPSENFNIALYKGATNCVIEVPPPKCPQGAACNPPAPQNVPCPQR
jgi:hypothetical protein